MKQELPKYVATSEGASSNADKLGWWKKNKTWGLPTTDYDREHVRVILIVHPSSAAAKQLYHMYSCLSNSFKLIIDRPALAVWRTILKHWVMLVSYFVLSTNFVRIMWKISLTSIMGKISGNNKLCKNWGIAFLGKNKGMNCKALILKPY